MSRQAKSETSSSSIVAITEGLLVEKHNLGIGKKEEETINKAIYLTQFKRDTFGLKLSSLFI